MTRKPRKPRDLRAPDGHIVAEAYWAYDSAHAAVGHDYIASRLGLNLKSAKQLYAWLGKFIAWAERRSDD